MTVFGFGKKITLTDDELRAFVKIAADLAGAFCMERPDFDELRVKAIDFCDTNLPDAHMPSILNMQGTIDFIARVEGVSRKAVINSNRMFQTAEKLFLARCSDLGAVRSTRLWGRNVAYCSAFVAAGDLAKRLRQEFGRQAFLASYPDGGLS
jgi:hypothetical protein